MTKTLVICLFFVQKHPVKVCFLWDDHKPIINHCFRIPIDQPGVHCKDPKADWTSPPFLGRFKLTLPEVLSRNSQKHMARAVQRSFCSGFLPMTCRQHWDFLKWWTLNVRKLHLTFKTKTPVFSDFSVGGILMDSPCSLFFWEGCRIIYLYVLFFLDTCFVFYIQGPPNIFHLSGKRRCKLLFPGSIYT